MRNHHRGAAEAFHGGTLHRRALVVTVGILAAMFQPMSAAAAPRPHPSRHVPASADGPVSVEVVRALGAGTRPAVGGGFNTPVAGGRILHSHGPDAVHGGGTVLQAAVPTRAPFCVTDPSAHHQRVLYAHLSGQQDRSSTQISVIRTIMQQLNHILNQAAVGSSGGATTADYKIACDSEGSIDVGVFQTAGASFGDVVNAAIAAGFTNPKVNYSIFLDSPATSSCGTAEFYDDDRADANNASNHPEGSTASYAMTYGGPSASGNANCWPTTTPMHENAHNMGAVQDSAPNSSLGGHCIDGRDVMCYPDTGARAHSYSSGVCATQRFDCGYDDYFNVAPEPGSYLAGHWNIGSPLNRFIHLAQSVTQVTIASDVVVHENAGSALVTIRRDGDLSPSFDVDFQTSQGTASDLDFTDTDRTAALGNALHFASGEATKTVAVPIINDARQEPTETIDLSLSNIQNASASVTIAPGSRRIIIRASDQQPDAYIKLAGASFRGSNVYNTSASGQSWTTSARRGATSTFYVTVQNDGDIRNTVRVRAMNSSGTLLAVNRSSSMTASVRSRSGRQVRLDPGRAITFRFDLTMGSAATGTEQFYVLATWSGDRSVYDRVRGYVRVR
jgi:hypothetical protein